MDKQSLQSPKNANETRSENGKAKWSAPVLERFGAVRHLTAGGNGSGADGTMVTMGGMMMGMMM